MKQLFVASVRDWEKNIDGTVEAKEVEMPQAAADEIRIKVAYSSFCGSDLHTLAGHLGAFEEGTKAMLPMSFGHELSGVIDEVGERAAACGFKKGDRVVPNYAKYCYCCDNCRTGHENLCQNLQFVMNGFAEYAVYNMTQVYKIPDGLDLRTACLVEPLTIALAAVEQAKVGFGKRVAVMGAGGLGLMIVQLCKMAGAADISVFDIVEEKLEEALVLGADHAFNTKDPECFEKAAAGGLYDCVIEGTGNTEAAKLALRLLNRDGDAVYFAMYGKDPILPVDLHMDMYWNQKHLHGLIMGAGLFPKAIKTIGRMNMDAIIQKEFPLSRYNEAVEALLEKKYAKVIIKMDE